MQITAIRVNNKYHKLDFFNYIFSPDSPSTITGRRGRDRMVVGFRTTYAIRAYHH